MPCLSFNFVFEDDHSPLTSKLFWNDADWLICSPHAAWGKVVYIT